MRFNSKELVWLAQQPAERFDKYGFLQLKEKQEGLFRKGEVYTERLFRLRGNLLFYFKTKDPASEPIGVIVLERCVVHLDPDEEVPFSFILAFEGDEKQQYLAARSERERDEWIAALHIASYECLKMQLQSLRERLRAKTGKDPIDNPDPSQLPEFRSGENGSSGEPFLELCLSCEGLPNEGRAPSSFLSVSSALPPSNQWRVQGHTEIWERSSNPTFMTTVSFSDPSAISLGTKLRIIVYDVKERMTNTMTQIGVCVFPLAELLTAQNSKLKIPLSSTDFSDPGHVCVTAWQSKGSQDLGLETLGDHISSNQQEGAVTQSRSGPTPATTMRATDEHMERLRPLYDNIITKTYCFPTNLGHNLSVHEFLGESRLCYSLPRQLLKLWVEEEKARIQQLQDLGELLPRWDAVRKDLMDYHMSAVTMYTQNGRYLAGYKGAPFKPSAKKGHKEVEFAPTNLHNQRMTVYNELKKTNHCYDICTVGAFTAYAQKFRQGGLRRMLRQLRDNVPDTEDGGNHMERLNAVLNSMNQLRSSVHLYCDSVCRAALQADAADLHNAVGVLADKSRQLIQVCESPLVEAGIAKYSEAKFMTETSQRPQSDPGPTTGVESPEKAWKWSGTDFIKSPTMEPWELTRLNTEAALMCVSSRVDELLKAGDATQWLEEVSPTVIKLKSCAEVMCKRAEASLTMLSLEECGQNVALMHTIKYRRDVVFSQALTSAVTAFITKLTEYLHDEAFLRQCFQIGVLMEFECLLSCHSDEMGMLEDMSVGCSDLSHVSFRLEESPNDTTVMPTVTGNRLLREGIYPDFNRSGYVVQVPLGPSAFQCLPKELQRGQTIKIVPVLFNIGINEQATIADRFGDRSVQEQVNLEGFQNLSAYWEKYTEVIGEPPSDKLSTMPVEQMLRHLHINVMSKKSKNVDTLHLAAEICRKLNGVRFTHCKSAKDRTSMGVTLEQCQVLQREHDLAAPAFISALDCMRSEGVRRENTVKNTGSRKYAFISLQLLSLPKLYRPPNGTFGSVQT